MNTNDSPINKSAVNSDLKALIQSLEEKRNIEEQENGHAFNSTLVKYNRSLAQFNLINDDPGLAEKYATSAFGYLKSSYDEALEIVNEELKQRTFHGIANEHIKLIKLLSEIKLSFTSRVDLNLLSDTFSALVAVSIESLVKDRGTLWIYVLEALNQKIKNNPIDIIDDGKIVEFIDEKIINNLTLSAYEYRDLQWLCVKIYHSLVRKERWNTLTNPEIANKLRKYRVLSATKLNELGDKTNAIADLAEGDLFKVFSCTTHAEWKKESVLYLEELARIKQRKAIKQWVIGSFYAKTFVKGYNVSTRFSNKLKYITQAMYYAEQDSLSFSEYIRPYYLLAIMINKMQEGYKLRDIIDHVDKEESQLFSRIPTSQSEDGIRTMAFYRALYLALGGESNTGVKTIDSICTLREAGILRSEKEVTDLLIKAGLSHTGSISGEVFDEPNYQNNEDLVKLNTMLSNQEGAEIEVKLSGDALISDIAETVCGFANTNGGKLIIGLIEKAYFSKKFPNYSIGSYQLIADEYVAIGYKGSDLFRQKLASYLKGRADLHGKDIQDVYDVFIFHVNQKTIMSIHVKPTFKLDKKLLSLDGEYFGRYDNQTSKMSKTEIVQKLMAVHA